MASAADRAAEKENKESKGKAQSLDSTLTSLKKRFGEGAIMRLGEHPHAKVESISTGAVSLDLALGIGGIPKGRITEIYGPEASGKTTICQHIIANAQKTGTAAFIDVEHAFDATYAQKCGVNIEDLLISQPDTGEQALEIAEALVRSGAVDVVVIDSVAALVPRAEIEGEMGDSHMGLHARLMSQALRKLTGAIKKSNTAVIFTNQLRQKIGIMFGNPETTTGGMALKFYASVRMDVRPTDQIKNGEDVIGTRVRVRVKKNKVAPPFTKAEFDILHNEGISREGDMLDTGVEYGIIEKRGAFYSYNGQRLGQGRENSRNFLRENPSVMDELVKAIRIKAGIDGANGAAALPKAMQDQPDLDEDEADELDEEDDEDEDEE